MVIFKGDVSTELRPETIGCEESVLHSLWIEAHLVARDRVYEGRNHLVEGVEKERDIDDEGASEALWIVGLKYVEDL